MAFDAGAIEATLTLNRNPFTAGLAAAKAQVDQWKKRNSPIEVDIKVNLKDKDLAPIEAKLKKFGTQIAKATAEVIVKRFAFDKLLTDLKVFNGRKYSANVDVDTTKATADVLAFRALLDTLNDRTINLRANTRGFGNDASSAFDGGTSHFAKMAIAVIAGLPVIASAFTATVGAVGALTSGLLIAGLGAGALAIVAVPVFKAIRAAAAGGAAEINKLPDGLRQAATAFKELTDASEKLIKDNQKLVAIGMSAWFNAGTAALKTLNPLIKAAANAFGDAGLQAITFFQSPWWTKFVDFLSGAIGPAVDKLFRSIFALIKIVGNLTQAFWDLGGSDILEMITKGLEDFATWTEKIGQNKTFQDFMEAAKRSLPAVGALLGELIVFIFKLAVSLEPVGTLIIQVLTGIFDAVNKIPPPLLGALALGFAAIWAAMALGAGGPVAIAVGVLVGLGTILADLYTKNESFRTTINNLVEDLKAKWQPIWDTIVNNFNTRILPAWNELVRITRDELIPKLQRFAEVIEKEVWPKIQPLVDEITGTLIPAFLGFLGALEKIIGFLVDVFGPTIAKELGSAITVFQGTFDIIAGILDTFTGIFTLNWTTFHQGLVEINRGFWTIVAGMFGMNLDQLIATVKQWDANLDALWRSFWDGITSFFKGVWATVRDIWGAALALLQGDVGKAADLIGQAWRRVANFFREPINWVIRTVIGPPGGLAGAWNTVMGWIGAPSLNVSAPPQIPAFAQGGRVRGSGTGTSDDILARVSNGEYVVPERITKKIWPFLEALRAGQTEALQAAGAFLGRGIDIPAYAGGGLVAAQQFAQSQHGPYVWGGVGPGGYDCSGFQSAITNVALGQFPYRRRFATASFGPGRGAGGFVPGLNSAYGIGVTPNAGGGVGHMAGTLGGMNVESSGGKGPHTGGGARGATNGLFPWKFSLPQVGGAFIDGGAGGAAPVSWWSIIADKVTSLFKGLFGGDIPGAGGLIGDALNNIPRLLVDKVLAAIKDKLEKLMTVIFSTPALDAAGGSNTSLGFGTADNGAIIPPGHSTLFNATGRPEPLTNLDVYERMKPAGLSVEDVLAIINAHGAGGGSGSGDTYNVMLPEKASVRELADQLDFKRRVTRMGRYSR